MSTARVRPAAPDLGWAAALLLVCHALSKIDVPARQAFTTAIVTPEQRVAAASLTTVARSVASGVPLLLSGGLAIAYDVTMWCCFRAIPTGVPMRSPGAGQRVPRSRVRPPLDHRRR